MKRKTAVVLTGSNELNVAIGRYLRFVVGMEEIGFGRLGDPYSYMEIHNSMHKIGLWIIEAFNPEDPQNPEGFRTAKKIDGNVRFLLLFTEFVPENFPEEGLFWVVLPFKKPLSTKIEEIIQNPPPNIKDFEKLEEIWPLLKAEPRHHHHSQERR